MARRTTSNGEKRKTVATRTPLNLESTLHTHLASTPLTGCRCTRSARTRTWAGPGGVAPTWLGGAICTRRSWLARPLSRTNTITPNLSHKCHRYIAIHSRIQVFRDTKLRRKRGIVWEERSGKRKQEIGTRE